MESIFIVFLQQIAWNLQEKHLISQNFWVGLVLVSLVSMIFGALSFSLVENPARLRILALVSGEKR